MIQIEKVGDSFKTKTALTPSKSISNRILIIRALSKADFEIQNCSASTDTEVLKRVLKDLPSSIDVNDSGTAFRFLTSLLAVTNGVYELSGSERMNERPIGKLVDALHSLGANVQYIDRLGYPPLKIKGRKMSGGKVSIDGSQSSQFVSSLLLIAPLLDNGLEINISGKVVSEPYIRMTLAIMNEYGVRSDYKGNEIVVHPGAYSHVSYTVENDWSAASFWYQAVAISEHSEVEFVNLSLNSIQGDSIIAEIMKKFNVITESKGNNLIISKNKSTNYPDRFEFNFTSCPDLVIPVSFTCATLKIKATFFGVENLRIKESDRLQALQNELLKVGSRVSLYTDYFTLEPVTEAGFNNAFISYNDHRMIMAEAMHSLVSGKVCIDNHLPVSKSYPEFWNDLCAAGFTCIVT